MSTVSGELPRQASTHETVEQAGIEPIEPSQQRSHPRELAIVLVAGNLSFTAIVFGWIPVTLGLGWWQAVTASLAGIAAGTLLAGLIALMGPSSRTTATVASGAFFGTRGRGIGVIVTVLVSVLYAGISAWTGGDAIVSTAGRWMGAEPADAVRIAGSVAMLAIIGVVAIYGHAILVRVQRGLLVVLAACVLLGIVAFAPGFDASYAGGDYALGELWPTWALAAAIAASGPLSYAPYLCDYTRYVSPSRFRPRTVLAWSYAGLFVALALAGLFGTFTAVTFADLGLDYVPALVDGAPGWYVLPILLIGIIGGVSQGSISLYDAGLQAQALSRSTSRPGATAIAIAATLIVVLAGTLAASAADAVSTGVLVLNALLVPWIVVTVIGLARSRWQVEVRTWRSSPPWRLPACVAWALGSMTGLAFLQTPGWLGPLAETVSGIDVSIPAAALVAAAAFVILDRGRSAVSDR